MIDPFFGISSPLALLFFELCYLVTSNIAFCTSTSDLSSPESILSFEHRVSILTNATIAQDFVFPDSFATMIALIPFWAIWNPIGITCACISVLLAKKSLCLPFLVIRILDLGFELWGHYILVSATVTGLVAWEACLMFAAVMIKAGIILAGFDYVINYDGFYHSIYYNGKEAKRTLGRKGCPDPVVVVIGKDKVLVGCDGGKAAGGNILPPV